MISNGRGLADSSTEQSGVGAGTLDDAERLAIQGEPLPAGYRHLAPRLAPGAQGELETGTTLLRQFLGVGDAEPIELTAFVGGSIQVAHARSEAEHIRLLYAGQRLPGYNGAYSLVNGPMDPDLTYRYPSGQWHRAVNGRATDRDIRQLRAVFIDCDAIRPKGISSTDAQLREALEVSLSVETWLADALGTSLAIGHGCSGNGYFTLIALAPRAPSKETTRRIARLLGLLQRKFGTPTVKIDTAVGNPGRLMPAPGTWKRKGIDSPERPHRVTSFTCSHTVTRVPLDTVA